jgi:membrane-bound serine protease (ClpP class)
MRRFNTILILILSLFATSKTLSEEIWILKVEGTINPITARYIHENIEEAEETNTECIIIEMDTPGGLMNSMRDIIKDILNSEVPIVIYVSPSGAQAASAGVFITVAAHFAIMSPATNIGAAHPVSMSGEGVGAPDTTSDQTMMEKVTNDAAAYIKSLAHRRGRNEEWVEQAVRESVSITETEALEKNVIDFIAKNVSEVIEFLDGKAAEVPSGEKVLNTKSAEIVRRPMKFHHKFLNTLSDPNLAYIFLILGIIGVISEIRSPGAIFPGVLGGIFLLLAFFSFQILPINYTGLALVILGIILLILEISIVSYGLLTIGGVVCMILGSMMLIDYTQVPKELFSISLGVILPIVAFVVLFFLVAFSLIYKAHKGKVSTGIEGLVGEIGTAITKIDSKGGTVIVHGEYWKATSDSPIPKNTEVIVKSVDRMILKVEKIK